MFSVILATTMQNGIGINNKMAWRCKEELLLFKEKTDNSIIIVGRKTAMSLPKLNNRIIYCLTKQEKEIISSKNDLYIFSSLKDSVYHAKKYFPEKKIIVAGGAQIYNHVLSEENIKDIDKVHLSIMKKSYDCDTYINYNFFPKWCIVEKTEREEFIHYTLVYRPYGECQYLQTLYDAYKFGNHRIGRNGGVYSTFVKHMKFDITKGFPLLTTKKCFFRGIVEELLFFIRGDTDSNLLSSKNIHIWDSNTNREFLDSLGMENRREGLMGPMYGYQWRNFNSDYDEDTGKSIEKGVDQLKNVIDLIRKDPYSRRILLTTYNPAQSENGVLYPCHSIVNQFYVNEGYLDCFCYNRSSDLFLGLPFNIASSSLFLILISKICNLTPRYLSLSLGDAHIYEEHLELVNQQLLRYPYISPTVEINKEINSIEDIEKLDYKNFILKNYKSHPKISGKMIA